MLLDCILRNDHLEKREFRGCYRVRSPQCPSYSLSEEALEGNLVSIEATERDVGRRFFFLRTIFKRFFREMLKIIIQPPSVANY